MFSGAANKRMSKLVEVLLSTEEKARLIPAIRTKLRFYYVNSQGETPKCGPGGRKSCRRDPKGAHSYLFLAANMPAANMREDGVRSISATCETCQHEAVLNADRWPADMPVPGRL